MLVPKPLLALLSALFVSTVAAQLFNDIVYIYGFEITVDPYEMRTRINSESEVEFCPLDPPLKVIYCTNSAGDQVALEDDRMPVMSVCVVAIEHGETSIIACMKNGIKIKKGKLTTEKGHIPVKKSSLLRRNTRSVAGLLAIVPQVLCIFFCKKKDGPPPNQLPTLTCASLEVPSPVIPNKGELDAVVTWTPATASDPEDGDLAVTIVPENFASGERYKAGHYSVSFYAKDNSGGGVQCSLTFQVEVITCGHPGWPKNGRLECGEQFTAFGRGCSIVCDEGHELADGSVTSIECTDSKTWNNKIPDCNPVACKPAPSVPNGQIQCPKGAYFNKLCGVVCEDGYSISGGYFVECDKQGEWPETIPQCKDAQAPSFTYCPDPIQVGIDSSNNTAYVEWDEPKSSDNAGDPTVTEINGKTSGRYEAGTHIIVYDIEDAAGNKGQSCKFTIAVQSISCYPPALDVVGKEHMKYTCPDFHRFGAECSLACKSGYPLVGEKKIQCLNVANANPPNLQWKWDQSGLKPYCKVSRCPDLKAPANGAIACDQWQYGNTCQMQCQDGFDVPQLPTGGGLFVCSTTNGNWIPKLDPPDCIVHDGKSDLKMGADLYYYTGVCNSSAANLKEIQENFIRALNSSVYKAVCVGHDKCQSRFVSVVCGPVGTSGRRKRNVKQDIQDDNNIQNDDIHNIEKRQTKQAYKVGFELILSIDVGSKSASQAMTDTGNVLNSMFKAIKTEVDTGKFDIADLEVKSDSLDVGAAKLDCATGMEARVETARCVGCGYGRFYSTMTSGCELCPIGTYQDQAHALTCTSCPDNTTTLYTSTRNSSHCLSYCEPGEYSATGLSPCAKCPSTGYQPDYRQTKCTACPALKRADTIGATGQQQCKDYNVQLKHGKPVNVGIIDIKTSPVVSVVTWLSLSSTSGRQTLMSLVSSDQSFNMSIQYNTELGIAINGVEEATGVKLQPHRWTQFAVTVDSDHNTVTVYINGNTVHNPSNFDIPRGVADGDTLIVDADVQLSSFQMTSSLLTSTDLQTWSSQCHFTVPDTFLSSDDLAKSQSAKSVVPSKCDAVDECLSSPCGSHGVCTNLQTGYECSCTGGYTGITCQDRPDPCLSNVCKNNATCKALITNYTCVCPYGYHGDLCEIKAVDGKMSAWSDWSGCSRSCGGGQSSRSRACDSPAPDPEGKPCVGDTDETRVCNERICPECLSLRRSLGVSDVVCNKTETLTRCRIQCQQGYELPVDSPSYYDCGAVTNYTWSHQTDDNPRARLPACSAVKAPTKLGFASRTKYGNLTCHDEATVLLQLREKLKSVTCASSAGSSAASSTGCSHSVTTNCNVNTSSTDALNVTIVTKSKDIPSGINIQEFFENNTVSDDLKELVQAIYDMETTAQEMLNDTSSFYKVTVNGVEHGITELPDVSSKITCKTGSASFTTFCIESPVGSYSDGLSVIMCSRGTYQDEKGSTSCKPCPPGFTTLEVGAESMNECSVKDNSNVTTPSVNQTLPTSSPTTPSVNQPVSSSSSTTPSVNQTPPTSSPTTPSVNQTLPTSSPTTPSVNQTLPTSSPTTPSVTQTVSSSSPTTPSVTQTVSSSSPTTPSVNQTRPTSSRKTSDNTVVIIGSFVVGLIILIGIGMGIIIGIKLALKRKRQIGRSCEDLQNLPYSNSYNPTFRPEKVKSNFTNYPSEPVTATDISLTPGPYYY